VALANLDLFEAESILSRVAERSHQLAGLLAEIGDSVPHVGDVRRWGLMVGLELVRDRARRTAYDSADRIGAQVARHARERGVILRPLGNVVILMPPLSITADELDRLVRVTLQSIETATA
jgi:adenosylmethionine-8-amino-7-oxononanoate aminotransferase